MKHLKPNFILLNQKHIYDYPLCTVAIVFVPGILENNSRFS
jgi:hypothetical protein